MFAKIFKGALIAMVGAGLTYVTEHLPNVTLGEWTPIVVAAWSVIVNIVRKLITGAGTAAVIFAALVPLAGDVEAQTAADWTWGPSVPVVALRFQDAGQPVDISAFDEGAGIKFSRHFSANEDGSIRWVSISIPVWLRYSADHESFGLSTAAMIGVFNDVISIGPFADLAQTGGVADSGLLLGDFEKHNFGIAVAFGLNFGRGAEPSGGARKAASSGDAPVPPGYVSLW